MTHCKIEDYNIEKSEAYLIDTNVLMYSFYTLGNYQRETVTRFSNFYAKIVSAGKKVVLPHCLLSEFVNLYMKQEYVRFKKQHNKCQKEKVQYKDYRQLEEFQEVKNEIEAIVRTQILPYAIRYTLDFSKYDISEMIKSANKLDINDFTYCMIAKELNIPIVTNDKDFCLAEGIQVIS